MEALRGSAAKVKGRHALIDSKILDKKEAIGMNFIGVTHHVLLSLNLLPL